MSPRRLYFLGLGLALFPTLAKTYLLWPFPGSQGLESIGWAYRLWQWTPFTLAAGALLAAAGFLGILRSQPPPAPASAADGDAAQRPARTLFWATVSLIVAIGIYAWTLRISAAAIFEPNLEPSFAAGTSDALPPETLVLAVRSGDVAKAYPLRLVAYHHQVPDTLGGDPIWVTYCTMCRTGKVFRPVVDGRPLDFELVGAVRFNSIYRDAQTGSFWYQANGTAVAGPAKGAVLPELYSDQMTLGEWLELYPDSLVLQPAPGSAAGYGMFGFDEFDQKRSDPEKPAGFQWVLGIVHDGSARGYLWSRLAGERLLQDEIGDLPVAVHLRGDGFSHRVWDRRLDGRVLDLRLDPERDRLVDDVSGSTFGFDGVAEGGELEGRRLEPVMATVEYRHSFEYFSGGEVVPAADL